MSVGVGIPLGLPKKTMININSGYKTALTIKGVPIRLHWTLPVGLIFLCGIDPLAWLLFTFIIFVHEAGHALIVHHYKHGLESIDILGFGGLCRWFPRGNATPTEVSVIAWGGVLAQMVLLAVTGALILIFGYPTVGAMATAAYFFVKFNLIIIGLNLIPIPPLDGHEAWKLVTRKFRRD